MFTFLLVVHAIIAASLVAVILMQRSEGGGLGMGGSPTGLMSARGAADFLTRATTVLAALFVLMSIGLAVLASVQHGPRVIDTSLARPAGAAAGLAPAAPAPATGVPLVGDPLAGAAAAAGNVVAPVPLAVPGIPAVAPATTPRVRRPRTGTGASEGAGTGSSSAPSSAAAPATAPRAAPPEPAATAVPQAPANSSPGTTNANGTNPPSQ